MNPIFHRVLDVLGHKVDKALKKAQFVDKPWSMIDGDLELQKLIFKANKDLLISKNGSVVMGKWEYLPEARSLLIDRKEDKILLNTVYLDTGAFILKRDGLEGDYLVFANQNVVSDLDLITYFDDKIKDHLNITDVQFEIGTFQVQNGRTNGYVNLERGQNITHGSSIPEDGLYYTGNATWLVEVLSGKIETVRYGMKYPSENNEYVVVYTKDKQRMDIVIGDVMHVNNNRSFSGEKRVRNNMYSVKDGEIISLRTLKKKKWYDL